MTFTTALDEVYREIEIMKKINHQNLCKLVEVIDDPNADKMYVILDLYQNGEIMHLENDENKISFMPNKKVSSIYQTSEDSFFYDEETI